MEESYKTRQATQATGVAVVVYSDTRKQNTSSVVDKIERREPSEENETLDSFDFGKNLVEQSQITMGPDLSTNTSVLQNILVNQSPI